MGKTCSSITLRQEQVKGWRGVVQTCWKKREGYQGKGGQGREGRRKGWIKELWYVYRTDSKKNVNIMYYTMD